jgi:AbrB family looped-hinge helix DNA binding protein
MSKSMKCEKEFFGTATINEKGQVVIPAQAREALHLGSGEKLLVFGMGDEVIAFIKPDMVQQLASHLSKNLATVNAAIKKSK